ncbi:MAG: hypothetical protein ACKVW3_11715 [Phycisphaerales bacterium]
MPNVKVRELKKAPAGFNAVAVVSFDYNPSEFDGVVKITRGYKVKGKDGAEEWRDAPVADILASGVRVHRAAVRARKGEGKPVYFVSPDGINVPRDVLTEVVRVIEPGLAKLGEVKYTDDNGNAVVPPAIDDDIPF